MQFTKTSVLTKDDVITEGKYVWTMMQLNGKDGEGKPTRWYMFVNEKANDKYYCMLSKSTFAFRQIIQTEHPSIDIKQGDSPVPLENRERLGSGPYPVIHTILTKKVMDNLATGKVGTYEIRGLIKVENKPEPKTEKLNISAINWLVSKEMEDGKLKSQSILKLTDKDKIVNVLKTVKPAFSNFREIVDKKHGEDGKFSAGLKQNEILKKI